MAIIGSLAVTIVANTQPFARSMRRTMAIAKSFRASMGGVAAGGVALAGAIAGLTRSFEQLNQSMNQSLAIMGDVSAAMRGQMTQAAIDVARTTKFSASEAAEAYFFLASAGLSAEQSLAALPQVAKFAQAGMFDLSIATDLATDAQSALGLTVDDSAQNLANLTRVTDVLVKANTLANASVQPRCGWSASRSKRAWLCSRRSPIKVSKARKRERRSAL